MATFTDLVLHRFNALTSEKLKGLHELRFRLADEQQVFNNWNNRRPSEPITFTDWEVELLNSRPESFPDYLTLLTALERLNFKARHWTRCSSPQRRRVAPRIEAHPPSPRTDR
jgi:hypothetical protein